MVVRCWNPRSRLVLFDVLPDLILSDPVLLADPDRLQALVLIISRTVFALIFSSSATSSVV